jgi:hypothetical protein
MVAVMPAQNAAQGPTRTGSWRWRRTQMTTSAARSMPSAVSASQGATRVSVLGDDVAGVAVAGHGCGAAHGGQGDGGEQARPDTGPPLAHGGPELSLVVEFPAVAGDGVVLAGDLTRGSSVTAGSDSWAVSLVQLGRIHHITAAGTRRWRSSTRCPRVRCW